MKKITQATTCMNCGTPISEAPSLPVEERQPCPECGSKIRKFKVHIQAAFTPRGMIAMKARHPGSARPYVESKTGAELYRETGEWRRLERVIDRDNDRYFERIVDAAGRLIRMVSEPLSQHRGRGSAKKGKRQ